MSDAIKARKEMSKKSWISNVMRIHPEKTFEETEALWNKIHASEADKTAASGSLPCPPNCPKEEN